jgi:hypothetical protein
MPKAPRVAALQEFASFLDGRPPKAATWGAWRHPMDRPYESKDHVSAKVYLPLAQRTAASNSAQPCAVSLVGVLSLRNSPTLRAGAVRPTIAAPLS